MHLLRNSIIAIFLFAITSCMGKQSTKAKIFERKETGDNRLMIKYIFTANGEAITDSTVIDNIPLNSDSVIIKYDPQKPLEHEVMFSK